MSKTKILIVDDSDFDRSLLSKTLSKKTGFEIIEADCGIKCLEMLETDGPDLILLDIMMPGMGGVELLLKIRECYTRIEVPVIMVTSKADASDVVEFLKAGANDYITKPVNFEIAVSRLKLHLDIVEVAKEISAHREEAAAEAVISTYHFEINNSLSSALSCVEAPDWNDPVVKEIIQGSLWKIADVLKSIHAVQGQAALSLKKESGGINLVQIGETSF